MRATPALTAPDETRITWIPAFLKSESVLTSAYGLVAFIALTPLITLQILGLVVKIKTAGKEKSTKTTIKLYDNDVIELNSER